MKTLIYQHPNAIPSISVDPVTGQLATACFDGHVRRFTQEGALLTDNAVASQLNACAIRNGVIVHDDASSTAKTGMAITPSGERIDASQFAILTLERTASGIDKTGTWCSCPNGYVYNRLTLRGFPASGESGRPPEGVELLPDGNLFVVTLEGIAKILTPGGSLVRQRLLTPEGLIYCDTDGVRFLACDFNRGLWLLDSSLNTTGYTTEATMIHSARFGRDGQVYYGTQFGQFVRWGGAGSEPITTSPPPSVVSKPRKGRK